MIYIGLHLSTPLLTELLNDMNILLCHNLMQYMKINIYLLKNVFDTTHLYSGMHFLLPLEF